MNYYSVERNERRTRQNALWVTATLYVALSAVIYLQMGDKPTPKPDSSHTTTPMKTITPATRPAAMPKA